MGIEVFKLISLFKKVRIQFINKADQLQNIEEEKKVSIKNKFDIQKFEPTELY